MRENQIVCAQYEEDKLLTITQRSAFLNNAQTAANNLKLNKSLFRHDSRKEIKDMF